jgi:erythromycin esterase
MRARLMPLRSVEPGAGFDDLRPLEKILEDVRVVGLGEATHGSHEIFTLKHRLIEFLVTRMGFTMLAIEGSVIEAARMNEYTAGRADRAAALDALRAGGWITETEELAALLDWLRMVNATVPEERRVRLVGLDPQGSGRAIDFLSDFLARAGRSDFKSVLDVVRTQDANALQFARTEISLDTLRDLYRLLAFLLLNEGDLSARLSPAEHRRAVEYARLLAQFGEFNASLPRGQGGTRDGYMADHLLRVMQAAPAGTRAIVWAHNSHIAARQSGSFPPMGGNLRKAFGSAYYALATAFDRGSFQAQEAGTTPPDLREYSIPAAAEGTLDWFVRQATATAALLDLRQNPPADRRIADWISAERRMHWAGAIFSEQSVPFQTFVPARDFDGIAFIPSTTRARPLGREVSRH